MRKTKLPWGSPDDTEQAFYDALQQADIDRLMACWADEDDIVCVHPGGPRLVGHAAVRAAFDAMFANGSVQAHPEKVRRLDAGHCSVHSVVERVALMSDDGLQQAWVVATNVYAKTAQGWRMVAHHASPGSRTEPVEVLTAQPVLH
ncbi:MAG: nuclear transport factor 2 family protein [Hydrogenophaga sp.]|jgi:ketosteroid isomerase-like protein|uniref:YybH family protein n=1 Tax=Hydrogenophaga sp. TaxID=1904254 RepID=UPI0027271576|nr:nuclear transport factor 2 family protein [Hydrogenophaga sp.]MDO9202154.1 nuclear transport factor 2 family protein [Hydrogenophaga sp.]MDO9481517.1 nuclear transport factor 2 family protein [Hydrogenophaga sp.]MDO9570448.1 nuclear transport factor 2 family protein [Hydrogenophaga sp.]MDP1893287.1 nuclear transport factor 2 family protein [Hydrogenophaga sp.]MDP2093488.1 nuclear transport factor 2 family protein [Hydrogenophaga sp.]